MQHRSGLRNRTPIHWSMTRGSTSMKKQTEIPPLLFFSFFFFLLRMRRNRAPAAPCRIFFDSALPSAALENLSRYTYTRSARVVHDLKKNRSTRPIIVLHVFIKSTNEKPNNVFSHDQKTIQMAKGGLENCWKIRFYRIWLFKTTKSVKYVTRSECMYTRIRQTRVYTPWFCVYMRTWPFMTTTNYSLFVKRHSKDEPSEVNIKSTSLNFRWCFSLLLHHHQQ